MTDNPMTREPEIPVTPAVRMLRAAGVDFRPHLYEYLDRGGTRHAAASLNVPEHDVVKTLVMEARQEGAPKRVLLVLMHGDCEVSTKQLARVIGVKRVSPASRDDVERLTGYVPGSVSPFGTKAVLPVYVEETVLDLERFFINGGRRGLQVEIRPSDLQRVLEVIPVKVGIPSERD